MKEFIANSRFRGGYNLRLLLLSFATILVLFSFSNGVIAYRPDIFPMKEDVQKNPVDGECELHGDRVAENAQNAVARKKDQKDIKGSIIKLSEELEASIASGKFNFCGMSREPRDTAKSEILNQAAGAPLINALGSGCPCNGGISVATEGCHIKFTCNISGDQSAAIEVTTPCPTVHGTDPKYPLVKMLSGTLVEWNESPVISDNTGGYLSRGAAGGTGSPGAFYGADL